jgi:hypothetical protein
MEKSELKKNVFHDICWGKAKHSETTPIFYWIYKFSEEISWWLFQTNRTYTNIITNHRVGD